MHEELRERALELPQLPGVYMMKDDENRVIYIGKAARLKNRVSSYFNGTHDAKTELMISKIHDFDYVTVDSEFEALVLEDTLIKQHVPKYNIKLRDDKGYPFIRVNMKTAYPMFKIVGKPEEDDALYLGPFGGRYDTRAFIAEVSKALKLPTCGKQLSKVIGNERPCLNHRLGNCRAYCQSLDMLEDYRETIQAAIDIFQGRSESLVKKLTKEMDEAAEQLQFEVAALKRDRINAIRQLEKKQLDTADAVAERETVYEEKTLKSHEWLRRSLGLEKTPERIEAYDISNTGASEIAASMTVFVRGKPVKSDYRRFKIKTRKKQDDYGSMAEVLTRRFSRYNAGDEKFSILPDFIIVDGGTTHASAARKVVAEAGLELPVFGMVKDDRHRTRALVTPGGEEIGLASNPVVFALIGTIQEETHRFAVEYHRGLRSKSSLKSKLDIIEGVGEKRRYDLLRAFGSVSAVAAATVDELAKVVPKNVAEKVYEHFNGVTTCVSSAEAQEGGN